MTDLAKQVAIETAEYRAHTKPPMQDGGNLPLISNGQPVKVFVYTFTGSGSPVAGFASKRGADTFYTGGIQWRYPPGSVYALFVTFVFLPGTTNPTGITCLTYSYSEDYAGPLRETKQVLCIPATTTVTPYPTFTVNYPGGRYDPQIVVTPQ
jgi:hypothetical protein